MVKYTKTKDEEYRSDVACEGIGSAELQLLKADVS